MPLKSYLIAPFNAGLEKNQESWLIPEDAFEILTNAYVWRGRIRKRFGTSFVGTTELNSRLRMNIGTTDGSGDLPATTVPGIKFNIGQMFSIGSVVFSVTQDGAMLSTGTATGTFNTTTGSVEITGLNENPTTTVYYYPADPVMGLLMRELEAINAEGTIAFDTQFSYVRSGGAWERLGTTGSGTALWSGTNSDFFWNINYRADNPYQTNFYVVNYTPADNIRFIRTDQTEWTNLIPQLNTGNTRRLMTAKILIGFKDRLLALNTIELEGGGNRTFQNRARWSQNGDPTVAATSWLDDTPGRGGYVDCPSEEAIIGAQFIKDQLVVYLERSTWELVYTGDATLPFKWTQLNNELGVESTFSVVGFDKAAVGVGNVGIHTSNGVNVERIDKQIPDEVFNIHNGNSGPKRVYGIRDFFRELVYWTYPSALGDPTFPTKILVWNYQNNTWAFFEESLTCFGFIQKDSDLTWATVGAKYPTWGAWNASWGTPQGQSQFPNIVAGNQQGYTFLIEADRSSNAQSLYITDMKSNQLTVINHNLATGDYVLVEGVQGINEAATINGTIYQITNESANVLTFQGQTFTGTYTGGGKLTRVSNFNITSKQWNPGTTIGQQFTMAYIDFLLNRTTGGEVSVDYLIDNTGDVYPGTNAAILGSNVLYTRAEDNKTLQAGQSRIWHRYFLQSQAQFLQIKIFLSDAQMKDPVISRDSNVQINALILYLKPQGRIIG